ncbi:MAG: hypothetical protein UZ14_CFX002000342 [Chloroflexi bacterium OLB14]|nr:MAG: hypothetical protein UZ14_CFX002000342 [Chloroflexi bacterium OLB14]
MKTLRKFLKNSEKGQAIILIAFAFVGLVGMVGLVTDTGLLLIEYGKLKKSIDAAAIAAAQQYRVESGGSAIDTVALQNAAVNLLNLNQVQNVSNIIVHSCEDTGPNRPALCNPDPINNPIDNRKLVEVTASADVRFGFLRVLGFESATLTATSVGEAATLDLVLIMDTSASMAFETGVESNCASNDISINTCRKSDADDDPTVCNLNNTCEPMAAVKDVAIDFIDTLYFPYDRVAIVTMTSQTPGGGRDPETILPLTSDKATVVNFINNIKVFEPRNCGTWDETEGTCLDYHETTGVFRGAICEKYQSHLPAGDTDPSSCPSSNIGGSLREAREALLADGDENLQRLDAFWVVVALFGGPANSTDVTNPVNYPNGFCPMNTWYPSYEGAWCVDLYASTRHDDDDPLVNYDNPDTPTVENYQISLYDADDYARDKADDLANMITGNGVTIYTIGLGARIKSLETIGGVPVNNPDTGEQEPPPAEDLLIYIATEAGNDDVKHGQYFYAATSSSLSEIFERIAKNIATKISQ